MENQELNQVIVNEKESDKSTLIPGIVADIDGVLVEVFNQLPGVKDTLKNLSQPLGALDPERYGAANQSRVPFLQLTNRGGVTEEQNAEYLNKIFEFQHGDSFSFKPEEQILNHTALKNLWETEFKGKLILIMGFGCEEVVATPDNHIKYITAEEYLDIYPELVPNSTFRGAKSAAVTKVSKRLGVSKAELQSDYLQIHGIFILQLGGRWEDSLQLILDLLTTEDGHIAAVRPTQAPVKHIPVFSSVNDIEYKDEFRLPRIDNFPFVVSLKSIYQLLYHQELEVLYYGKPAKVQYDFTEQYLKEHFVPKSMRLSRIYMIGDNPYTDIQGANLAGWCSILVKTGIWNGLEENDIKYPATHVVHNFNEAIKLIFELEGISTDAFAQK